MHKVVAQEPPYETTVLVLLQGDMSFSTLRGLQQWRLRLWVGACFRRPEGSSAGSRLDQEQRGGCSNR